MPQDPNRSRIDQEYEDKFNSLPPLPPEYDGDENEDNNEQSDNIRQAEADESRNLAARAPRTQAREPEQTTDNSKPQGRVRNFLKKRNTLLSLGIGGGAAGFFALLLLILPLKVDSFIANATEAASAVPKYAVEERGKYLLTRALATRLLMVANKNITDVDGKLAFCGNASISCSLFTTYTATYFEEKMDMDFTRRTDGKVRVTINPKGRESLGAKAKSWDIVATRDFGENGILQTIKSIETNKEMKLYIKDRVNKNLKTSGTITRWLARRILMKKYGVTHWRAFEKPANKLSELKTDLKTGFYKNTAGKIFPRLTGYLACLQGGATCDKLQQLSSTGPDAEAIKQQYGDQSPEYKKALKQQEAYAKISQAATSAVSDAPGEGALGKVISKKLIGAVGGAAGAIVLIDTVLGAVASVDSGALEKVNYDMVSQAYTGFAFGDEVGIVTNDEKRKAGKFESDSMLMSELDSMVDCKGSALCAQENGIIPEGGVVSAASTQIMQTCSTEDGDKPVLLDPGEVVCTDQKLVRDLTSAITKNPSWKGLAAIAKVWEATPIGTVIDLINSITGALVQPAYDAVAKVAKNLGLDVQKLVEWGLSMAFDIPDIGYGSPTSNNFVALSGGIHLEQNELMGEGVDESGKALGGGGRVLTVQEREELQALAKGEKVAEFNKQSTFAKLFNPSLSGSVAQKLIIQSPMNLTSLASLPLTALQNFSAIGVAGAATSAKMSSSPFGLPIYGYVKDAPELTADPTQYTAESCTASAAERLTSFKTDRSISAIGIYTKSDPCALEKVSVCASLAAAGVKDDPNSCPAVDAQVATGDGLKVMTYNILGSNHSNDGGISVDTRANNVVQTVVTHQTAIVGFQEVNGLEQQKVLKEGLGAAGYLGFPDIAVGGQSDQRPIYWSTAQFDKIDGGKYTIPKGGNNSAEMTWVKLQAKGGGAKYFVINVHLSTSSSRERTVGISNMIQADKTFNTEKSPVIMTGDFNSTCGEEPCKTLAAAGYVDAESLVPPTGKINGDCATIGSVVGKINCNSSHHIDHVFLSAAFATSAGVSGWENIVDDTTKKASDHMPVLVTIGVQTANSSASMSANGFAWPLGADHWKNNQSAYLRPHTGTGTAWGSDNFGTKDKGPGIASDIGMSIQQGMPVYAMADGVVTSTSLCKANDGIAIKSTVDGGTLGIAYMHGKNKKFKVGDQVKAGQQIMEVGEIGCNVHGVHLHVGMAYNGDYVCPQDVFVAMASGSTLNFKDLVSKGKPSCGGRKVTGPSPL